MSDFTEPLEKGWLREVLTECKLRSAAHHKVDAMSIQELAAFIEEIGGSYGS